MSKEKSLQSINSYLKLYSQEQLDLIEKVIEVYSRNCIGKGMIMNLAFTREERGKMDTALPHDYVQRIKELMPSFDTFSYVYDYNEPTTYGAMKNVFEALHIKLQTVLNSDNFEEIPSVSTDIVINVVEVASELADRQLRSFFLGEIDEEKDGVLTYTEKAQDVFNELYDEYYTILKENKI